MTSHPLSAESAALSAFNKIADASGVDRFEVAIVVGSGWGNSLGKIGAITSEIVATDVPGFLAPSVKGHPGKIWTVRLPSGNNALIIGARSHLYESRGIEAVVHPVRTAAAAGAKKIILTNGAGGIKPSWSVGQVVLISDHINLTGCSPLNGPNFVDMTDLYSANLRALARTVDPSLDSGIYVQFKGPQYETPAEIQMARAIGGEIVGMSTALEAIAARKEGLEILGLSLITNMAAGISQSPLSHEEVIEAGKNEGQRISSLLAGIVQKI